MNTYCPRRAAWPLVLAAIAFTGVPATHAEGKKSNPSSKLYVSDVSGEAQIDTGKSVEDLAKRAVYSPEGTVIETKAPTKEQDRSKYYSTMVYSNGTGAFLDADTRVEVRRFQQEPFTPTRTDNEVEPSISQTQAFLARGTVGLCNSKMVAGSVMSYTTPLGSLSIRGQKVVMQAEAGVTKFSMLEGDSTVKAGPNDMGGRTLHSGEQAVIRAGSPGEPNQIQIIKIPANEASELDQKVTMACMAKKTVYFQQRRPNDGSGDASPNEVDAFSTQTASARVAGGPFRGADGEIIAIPVVPKELPVQFTISPATLPPSGSLSTPPKVTPPPGG